MNTLLVLSLALVAGLIFTRIMKVVGLPDVTGYLIAGLLIGPYVLNLMDATNLQTLNVITTVALGFIAFSIGSSFKLANLKQIGSHVVVITFCQALLAVLLVDVALWAIGAPLPLALTLGAIATATAPAATLMVVRQYRAKGIVTDTLLPVVAFDDAIGLMVFSISLAIAKVLALGTTLTFTAMILEPLGEIGLSLVIGAALGLVLSLVSRVFKSRANRITLIIATVFGGLALSQILNLSNLLVCMMVGAFYANMFKENEEPLNLMEQWTYPLYMLFFVISGADLKLDVILTVGVVGIVYILARSVGKYFGAAFGAKLVKADKNVVKYLGFTLLPQAGVAIGMAQIVITELPSYGVQISTVVLCATFFYELIGPLLTKMALQKSGEIDKDASRPSLFKRKPKEQKIVTEPVTGEDQTVGQNENNDNRE